MIDAFPKSHNPFVGLRPFDSNEALLFFGRGDQTVDLLERLHHYRFLAVVGSSGCGKSSLIRAGLIPKLKAGMLVGDRDKWFVATMKPGDRPWYNLSTSLFNALTEHLSLPKDENNTIAQSLFVTDASAIINTVSPILKKADANLLLLVDQFEEIFRYRKNKQTDNFQEEAADFVSLMLSLAEQRNVPIYVVITMRSDFLGECDRFFGLPEMINQSIYLVPRLTRKQRQESIEGPIHLCNQKITPRLLSRLLNDAGDESDQLPILQHVLMRMWNHWKMNGDCPLDIEHYLAVGTMDNALSMDAEDALEGMTNEELILTEQIFKALTDTDPGNRQVRHPALLSEIKAITNASRENIMNIIERFRTNGRSFLIVSESEIEGDLLIDISHESLIRQWGQLKKWVAEESEARSMYLRLVESAFLHKSGRVGLWRDPELQVGLDWKEEIQPNKAWGQRYNEQFEEAISFLNQSKIARDNERTKKRKKIILIISLGFLITSSVLYYIQQSEKSKARQKQQINIEKQQKDVAEQQKKKATQNLERINKEKKADSLRIEGNKAIIKNYKKSYADYNSALSTYEELKNTDKCALTFIDIGRVHLLTKDYAKAEEFYYKALEKSKKSENKNLEGQILEQFAILSEQKGYMQKAKQYYIDAQSSYANSGEYRSMARILERLALMDEEIKNFEEAKLKYKQALKYYDLLADQLSSIRLNNNLNTLNLSEKANKVNSELSNLLEKRRTEKQSSDTSSLKITTSEVVWGYLVDLQTTTIYNLKGDLVNIGRSTEEIKNDISFSNNLISRRHLLLTKDLKIDDLRSRNGTSINGHILRYGISIHLNDKDIITLADIKVLLFSEFKLDIPKIPANTWGILIDNKSRKYTYLTDAEYGLKIKGENIIPYANESKNVNMRLRWTDPKIEIFEVKDEWKVIFQNKETDYDYKTYIFNSGQWYEILSKPLWYVQLSKDGNNILKEGPEFQIVSFKEPVVKN